jgi:hypothetical protein
MAFNLLTVAILFLFGVLFHFIFLLCIIVVLKIHTRPNISLDCQKVKLNSLKKVGGEKNWCFKGRKIAILEVLVLGVGFCVGVKIHPFKMQAWVFFATQSGAQGEVCWVRFPNVAIRNPNFVFGMSQPFYG